MVGRGSDVVLVLMAGRVSGACMGFVEWFRWPCAPQLGVHYDLMFQVSNHSRYYDQRFHSFLRLPGVLRFLLSVIVYGACSVLSASALLPLNDDRMRTAFNGLYSAAFYSGSAFHSAIHLH